MKRFLSCLSVLLLLLTLIPGWTACDVKKQEGLTYTSNGDGTCFVSGFVGKGGAQVVIPEVSPAGDRVTGIGDYAFRSCSFMESITIPEGVTEIGRQAFYRCVNLKSVILPDTVMTMSGGVFKGCYSLGVVQLPKGLQSISDELFSGCLSLSGIFLPDGVTHIGASAFYGCHDLAYAELPDHLETIGKSAFYGCKALTSISIPATVSSIGSDAFGLCESLNKVSVEDLSAWCGIRFHNQMANPLYYAKVLAQAGRAVTHLTIPADVKEISDNAFTHCHSVQCVILPEGLEAIGENAFNQCLNLTDVHFEIPKDQISKIGVESGNEALTSAERHYPEE